MAINRMCFGCNRLFPAPSLKSGRCGPCAAKEESVQRRGIARPGNGHRIAARRIREEQMPCALCGQRWGDPANPITVGHIIPRSRGGSDEMTNLRPECRKCNYGNSRDAHR